VRTTVNRIFKSNNEMAGNLSTINISMISGNQYTIGTSGGYSWIATKSEKFNKNF
jgi:hypothetical protein